MPKSSWLAIPARMPDRKKGVSQPIVGDRVNVSGASHEVIPIIAPPNAPGGQETRRKSRRHPGLRPRHGLKLLCSLGTARAAVDAAADESSFGLFAIATAEVFFFCASADDRLHTHHAFHDRMQGSD